MNASELRGRGRFEGAFDRFHVQLGAGAYVGVASAAVACLAAVALRRNELARRPSVTSLAAVALTLGLLAAFLLPWLQLHIPHVARGAATGYRFVDRGDDSLIFPAALACFGLGLWTRSTPPGRRLVAAVGIAVLTVGGVSVLGTHVHWNYEAWLQLGCSLGLVVLALVTGRGLRIGLPSATNATVVFGALLLVVSLFLPWQKFCVQGTCSTASGWTQTDSVMAGGLAVTLLVLLLGFRHFFVELAVGAAVYVMAAGFAVTQNPEAHLGWGAPLGFAGGALLLFAAARRVHVVHSKQLLVRFIPLLTCVGFLAIPVAALTGRLSIQLELESPWRLFWLGTAAIVLTLRLFERWVSRPSDDAEFLLLPLALLTLTAMELIYDRGSVDWQGWLTAALCVLLVALGWIERSRGLKGIRVPEEFWRIDRLPEAES